MDRYFGRFWIDWNIFYFFIDYEPKVIQPPRPKFRRGVTSHLSTHSTSYIEPEENMEEDLLTLRFFDLMVSVDVVI